MPPSEPGAGPTGPPGAEAEAWAASGLMALTGRPDGPGLGPPAGLVATVGGWAATIHRLTAGWGGAVEVDPLALLAERAAYLGLSRRGAVSCGGATRLLASADGWVAVSLARPSDWEMVDAWLQPDRPVADGAWERVAAEVVGRATGRLLERGALMGLPVAALGERRGADAAPDPLDSDSGPGSGIRGVRLRRTGTGPPTTHLADLTVVDLSSLWAGPLAGALLQRAGARVVKVESVTRPDGARQGSTAFYRALNAGKRSLALDLGAAEGRTRLWEVLGRADVVISSSRPRALEQLGVDPVGLVRNGGPRVWLSISGYGAAPPDRDRVAFGDDAAAAGGLVCWDERGPCFCGDAIADPLAGLASAVAALEALHRGDRWVIGVSMADVAAGVAGPRLSVDGLVAAAPRPPAVRGRGPVAELGADNDEVIAELGLGRTPAGRVGHR